ncbi:hypothetical protein PENSUB_4676 [Penicillium subrubescens]|uniref:Uncharacterized protein n=1 Tax=Penicillium subrubescens TaxID=1316194 RepID=A0A1Q5UBV9_9EURO|nr:hypothetical protein PENSUB_4676 [Penicillium subrubescens]
MPDPNSGESFIIKRRGAGPNIDSDIGPRGYVVAATDCFVDNPGLEVICRHAGVSTGRSDYHVSNDLKVDVGCSFQFFDVAGENVHGTSASVVHEVPTAGREWVADTWDFQANFHLE